MSEGTYEGIAIIGMSGRFPGADSIDQFWKNLLAGKEAISFFSEADLAESGLNLAALKSRGHYVAARGVLNDADCFDAAFFNVHPKEAEVIDPQHRIFLELCWAALEHAGYAPNAIKESVGVFAGATFNTYYLHALHNRQDLIDLIGPEIVMFGNERDYIATRVAYKLGLKGPALNVSTACSTSLVAVCQACQSLLMYQCDMALAGGISITVPQKRGYYHDDGNIGSIDGHTRTFDAAAAGTAFSNGAGVVILKRLADAVKDGDQIYAVIKGAALNNDGSQRVSFGAPGVEGQSEVISMAHALAGISPETISYVEAHGTATPFGDPIEVAGLTKAFRGGTDAKQFCAIGSVKSNVGHLDVASGVTGLIKTALALHHRIIPASLHFTKPNPKMDLENSPFYVNSTQQAWKENREFPRRAGVSSFGTGGTNAHIVAEEAPDVPQSESSRPWQLLALSAKTSEALDRATGNLAAHLKQLDSLADPARRLEALADAVFTLQTGRSDFAHRRIAACRTAAEGAEALLSDDAKRVFTHHQRIKDPEFVFMFPGQGAQYAGMGAELYETEPVFRNEADRCAELLQPILGVDVRPIVFANKGLEKEADQQLVQTRLTQPALFMIEYALAKLWMSWGIKPSAMIGHSVGEYVAACLGGVFSLEDALSLVAKRGALVQAQPGGAMLAVRISESEILPLLIGNLSIAAINSPKLCVVAGPFDAIEEFEKKLAALGAVSKRLPTSHAFHSQMMEPVLAPFSELLRKVKFHAPQIPILSNVTARWITPDEATSVEYWAGHVRQTVRFADGVAELFKDPDRVLLEVGPGQTLATLSRQHPAKSSEQMVLATLSYAGEQELRGVTEAIGRLWLAGASVDWNAFYAKQRRRRVPLPTYPFERKRYWPASAAASATQLPAPVPASSMSSADGKTAAISVESVGASTIPVGIPSLPIAQPAMPRKDRLLAQTRKLLEDLSGYDLSGVDPSLNLLELGLDSLLLTQAAQLFQRKFGVTLSFRQLIEDISSVEAIATHLDAAMPPDAPQAPEPLVTTSSITPAQPTGALTGIADNSDIGRLIQQQQQLTNQIVQLLSQRQIAGGQSEPNAKRLPVPPILDSRTGGPFKPMQRGADVALTPRQTRALDSLIARYTKRTAGSKRLAAQNRPILADPRSVSGFKQLWKEMVYPITTVKSDGSKVWDIDGNEYIDFVMGFGANLFGHRPPFVVKAMHEQLDIGFEIGPIQPLAGDVATLVREFTGMERVAFTNTGSEAVLAATRVARTVSGRDKIAVFAGAYHGIFDEMLFRPLVVGGETRTAAIAPGVPASALENVVVLEYGSPQALEFLEKYGDEFAAVLVEPVQSRRLELQPKEFLHELRRITHRTGTAFIMDEVVTGFRVHPGGAQAYFGVRADLATYGKVIGGGVSIGVVSGDAKYMDALDGGKWQYGDTSFPEVGVTFFAGTFMRHPLALAAAKAVLTHLKNEGPELQQRLADRTEKMAAELHGILREYDAPYDLGQFSSLMYLTFPSDQKYAGLLFYLLRERGIHNYEGRLFVMTTAHTEQDLSRLSGALRESLAEMRAGDFLPRPTDSARHRDELPTGQNKNARLSADNFASGKTSIDTRSAEGYDRFPLTEPQKEIWLAAQMGGEAALGYNESISLKFAGPFEVQILKAAAQTVVQRHPILLANISADGQWQQINPATNLEIPFIDLSGTPDGRSGLDKAVAGEISTPFDLAAGPLLRVKIVCMSADHHVVVWTAHHIVSDGWSTGVVVSELASIYSALKKGEQPQLEPAASFRDYAISANENDAASRSAIKYWQQQYTDIPQPLDFPLDHVRPAVRTAGAATIVHSFGIPIHQALKKLAGQQRTTLVVLLMAGLKTLLHRLTGQSDLIVGLPVAGQAVSGQDSLVGHCVNLLPVRTKLQPDHSFKQNLATVRKNVLDAFDHHQSTIGSILKHLSVPRSLGRPPLIEVIFNLEKDPSAVDFTGIKCEYERNPKRALHFDIFFNFVEGPSGLHVECDFNTDLFVRTTIERWLNHYGVLMEAFIANPEEHISRLPLLTDSERKEILADRTGTLAGADQDLLSQRIKSIDSSKTFAIPVDGSATLHGLFEAQVARRPDAVALTCEGKSLTYAELNAQANRVAHELVRRGVKPETLVGLCLDRSSELVVAILAILKAGGAYLPIDLSYPAERRTFLLEDAQAPVLLTHTNQVSASPATQAEIICIDEVLARPAQGHDETNLSTAVDPDNLAYVIYTSGTTGKPKGSLITHRNVVRLFPATDHWYGFTDHDVWTLFHSCAFDFSVWEIWGALLFGGRLVVVPFIVSRTPESFYELLAAEQVTVLNQTPSAFRQLIQVEESVGVKKLALRYVIFGGEALDMQTLGLWFDRHGDQKPLLVNMYGITETTVHVTYRPLSKADLASGSLIGVPIGDLKVYVLDRHMQPMPIGVPGEMYVGGPGLARGYLRRPELTDERFLPNHLEPVPGSRIYKTGDLAKLLPSRDIEYLGRLDDQVKIRGFRIELGEIQAALDRYPGIGPSVVIAREDQPGDKRLVAYFEAPAELSLTVSDLRRNLKKTLPDYMIPSAFVALEKLPLTTNGKIDRTALPAPNENRASSVSNFVAPRDPVEQVLCHLWSRVLKIKPVGVRDNFFELGGHSLLAVRIIVEIEKVYKRRLPLATLLQAQTIEELAEVVRKENWKPSWPSLVPLRPGGSKPPLFLMHSHGGNVLEYRQLADRLDPDQPVFALQARGLDGRIVKDRSIEMMAADYLEDIRSLQPEGPYFLGGFCFGGLVALEAARQITAAGDEVALVIMLQSTHPATEIFHPNTPAMDRWWHRTSKRIDLERENLSFRGVGYIRERARFVWSMAGARIRIAYHNLIGNGHSASTSTDQQTRFSTSYILESLAIEHDKAYEKYVPQPYFGDVLLFRANKQLPGLESDPLLGWKDILLGNLDVCEVPGHQQNILTEPNLSRLAPELSRRLEAIQQRHGNRASALDHLAPASLR